MNKESKRSIEMDKKLLIERKFRIQYCLDLRKPDLRKNLDLRKIVATTDFFST